MADPSEHLLVACLCAAWCHTCNEYRPVFEQQAASAGVPSAWIDIEDDEAVLEGIDIDDFPTILIVRGNTPLFFGPITPQPQTLARMLQAACDGDLHPSHPEPSLSQLASRVRLLRSP